MAISPLRLTIYLYSAHRAVIFEIAQLSCFISASLISAVLEHNRISARLKRLWKRKKTAYKMYVWKRKSWQKANWNM